MKSFTEELLTYLDANYPILYIKSLEELKVDAYLRELSQLSSKEIEEFQTYSKENLEAFLEKFLYNEEKLSGKLIVLKNLSLCLKEGKQAKIIASIKELALRILSKEDCESNIIIVDVDFNFSRELKSYIRFFELPQLKREKIKEIIEKYKEKGFSSQLEALAKSLETLSETEIHLILNLALMSDKSKIKEIILKEKVKKLEKNNFLKINKKEVSMKDVGGLDNLKIYLKKKAKIFQNLEEARDFGVDLPKGILLLGMPACGKTLFAEAASDFFGGLPLLTFNLPEILGENIRESEKNMKEALKEAESLAPCLLLIDEMEKIFDAFEKNLESGEERRRLFSSFLTWMQEKKRAVFVLATVNDINNFPLEFLRKDKFDEVFFIDLPNIKEREEIFKIHILKRKKAKVYMSDLNIEKFSYASEGFSGADIKNIVKEVIEENFLRNKKALQDEDFLTLIRKAHPLSKIFPEKINEYKKVRDKMKIKNASKEKN